MILPFAELRTALGWTQRGTAEIFGVSLPKVIRWERGREYPKGLMLDVYVALDAAVRRGRIDDLLETARKHGRAAFFAALFR